MSWLSCENQVSEASIFFTVWLEDSHSKESKSPVCPVNCPTSTYICQPDNPNPTTWLWVAHCCCSLKEWSSACVALSHKKILAGMDCEQVQQYGAGRHIYMTSTFYGNNCNVWWWSDGCSTWKGGTRQRCGKAYIISSCGLKRKITWPQSSIRLRPTLHYGLGTRIWATNLWHLALATSQISAHPTIGKRCWY